MKETGNYCHRLLSCLRAYLRIHPLLLLKYIDITTKDTIGSSQHKKLFQSLNDIKLKLKVSINHSQFFFKFVKTVRIPGALDRYNLFYGVWLDYDSANLYFKNII